MTTDELKELYERDKQLREVVDVLQLVMCMSFEEVMVELCKVTTTLEEQTGKLSQSFNLVVAKYYETTNYLEHRPPAVIKKELKHEKNPMRIKQLNSELTASCRHYKKH